MTTKRCSAPAILLGLIALPLQLSHAATLVNDTWLDGTRTNQEAGVDSDSDGNIESAWFGGGLTSTAGHLTGAVGSGSASWTTYFAAEGNEATLANAGDTLTVSWTFSLTGINATNNSQGFRIALVNSPAAARVSTDAAPGSSTYAGYGMFMNIGQTLGHANPFNLMERAAPATSSALLSASASWASLDDQETTGVGYTNGTSYTFTMTLTRGSDASLMINATMVGGPVTGGSALGGDGTLVASFSDTTPNSFAFDTFSLRPSSDLLSASSFDTTSFVVTTGSAIPEPASCAALVGLGVLALTASRRQRARA